MDRAKQRATDGLPVGLQGVRCNRCLACAGIPCPLAMPAQPFSAGNLRGGWVGLERTGEIAHGPLITRPQPAVSAPRRQALSGICR